MKKIRFIIGGGLGNQLFQYAAYLYVQQKYQDVKVSMDLWQYYIDAYHNGIELTKIFNLAEKDYIDKVNRKRSFFKRFLSQRKYISAIDAAVHKILRYKVFYDKDIFTPDQIDEIISCNSRMTFSGFFQSPEFPNAVKDILLLKRDYKFSQRNLEFLEIISGKETVSVHIRRGDYMSIPEYDVFDGIRYYEKAIEYIYKFYPNAYFVFFSDDISWVRKNFNLSDASYVNWNTGMDSYQDMLLMSKCHHNILANSSFSWWGAFLNENKNAIRIVPSLWFKHRPSSVIVPKDWIQIDN